MESVLTADGCLVAAIKITIRITIKIFRKGPCGRFLDALFKKNPINPRSEAFWRAHLIE